MTKAAFVEFLLETKATKSEGTYDAYRKDLDWLQKRLDRRSVAQVRREDLVRLLGVGRDEGKAQQTINRAVQTGLMALRNAGATITMKKGDWPDQVDIKLRCTNSSNGTKDRALQQLTLSPLSADETT